MKPNYSWNLKQLNSLNPDFSGYEKMPDKFPKFGENSGVDSDIITNAKRF